MSMYGERTKPVKKGLFYSAYSEHLVVGLTTPAVSEYTDQSFADECDINTIMAKYQSTGELPYVNEAQAQWLDVTGMDFHTHMQFIVDAENLFDELPSAIRDRFHNDPAEFLDFTSDENNRKELAQMGLLTPEATQAILWPEPEPAPVKTAKASSTASDDAGGTA